MRLSDRHNWSVLLIPFSWLYGLVIWIRNALYDNGFLSSKGFNIPIISVGNIAVGGTGKTPHVEYLTELLGETYMVATLSRGYGRKTRDFRLVSTESSFEETGDEPLQIKRRFPGITVAVDRKRINGVSQIMKLKPPVDLILLDDAYQHRSLKPGFSILLIDYSRPLDRDYLLPAGRLREPAVNRNRANIILVTKSPATMQPIELREYVKKLELSLGQHLFFTTFRYGDLIPVFKDVPFREKDWFKNFSGELLMVAGIANPHTLRQYSQGITDNFNEMIYPDHHRYGPKDMVRITRRYTELKKKGRDVLILTTEKDAIRLRDLDFDPSVKDAFHAIRVHVEFLNDDKDEFDLQILNYVNSNKRSSILYQEQD